MAKPGEAPSAETPAAIEARPQTVLPATRGNIDRIVYFCTLLPIYSSSQPGQPPIPATDSISELAAFWSTHDLTDYEDELEAVEGPVFAKPAKVEDLVLHLDPEEAVTVREAARAKGIDEAAIVREWIREHAPKAAG